MDSDRSRLDIEPRGTSGDAAQESEKPFEKVVHELRNVITGLVGNLTLIHEDPELPPQFVERLAALERAAHRARTLSLELNPASRPALALGEDPSSSVPNSATPGKPVNASVRARPESSPAKAGRILAMDDEPGIRTLLSAALTHFGYEATTVPDGSAAIREYQRALAENKPYSAVIMDLTVPGGMGGQEAIKALQKIDPSVKAIVSSGQSADAALVDYRSHGFVARVEKPYRIQELGGVLRATLES